MRKASLAAVGVAAFVVALAWLWPASQLTQPLESATRSAVALSGAAGTVSRGSATVRLRAPGGGFITLERVDWNWRPHELFRGRLAFDVVATAGGLTARGTASRTPLGWELEAIEAEGPASALAALHPAISAASPAGRIALRVPALRLDGTGFTGEATVDWADAGLAIAPTQPLGSWHMTLAARGGPASLALTTDRGPLRLSGQGTLTPAGKATFSGEARAEAGREADLASLLSALGPRRADGAHTFSLP